MKPYLILLIALVLAYSTGLAQTREERVKKTPYRLLSPPDTVKSRLLKEGVFVQAHLTLNNSGNGVFQKAFVKVAQNDITAISLDTTKSIKDNRTFLNSYWSNHHVHSTYFVFNGHSTDAVTNKLAGKFVIIEIEDEELTGTVSILYPIKKINGKWKFINSTPEFAYFERN